MNPSARHLHTLAAPGRMGTRATDGLPHSRAPHHEEAPR